MRSATSMIELVFAIVIMGIAVMSLPLILTQVESNNAFALQQESILAAKAEIGNILTYEWDANSYDSNDSHSFVLTTNGDSELNPTAGTQRRVGHINADYRRKFSPVARQASAIVPDGILNDVDDFNGASNPLTVTAGEDAGALDYVFNLNLTTRVNYADDNATYNISPLNGFALNFANAPATPTNIKVISVTVSGGDQNITLRSFTCNIGESTLLPSRPYR